MWTRRARHGIIRDGAAREREGLAPVRVQHELVDGALRRRERAADGPGARDVAGVAVQLAAGVHQHQLPGAHPLQHARRPPQAA